MRTGKKVETVVDINTYRLPCGKVLCLRTCDSKLKSRGGFQWKEKGTVECSDWSEVAECGHGLHGLLWGQGDGGLLDWSEDAKWLVVEVSANSIVDLSEKVKFPKCNVVYCGERKVATDIIAALAPRGTTVVGLIQESGDRSTITGGDGSTITGGYGSTITGGDGSTITLSYWDSAANRRRVVILYPGENGIKANVKYRLDYSGNLVEVPE